MKTEKDIKKAFENVLKGETNYSGMTYEQGIEDALSWVLEEMEDDEFEFA